METMESQDAKEKIKIVHYTSQEKAIFFVLFLFLGLINNMGSVLIVCCSKQFSSGLDMPHLVALYPLAVVVLSSLCRLINSHFCLTISYNYRIFFISIYFFIGYISLFIILLIVEKNENFSKLLAFCLTLIPTIIMGTGQAFGEANILGYLRTFPKDYVSGWSSGTGLAGVVGAAITLLFKLQEVKTLWLYLIASPVTFIYFFLFVLSGFLSKGNLTAKNAKNASDDSLFAEEKDHAQVDDTALKKENEQEGEGEGELVADVKDNRQMSCINFKESFGVGKKYIINLALVYYFEYSALYGFGERVSTFKYIKERYFEDCLYEYFCLCYQVGVLISRSSLCFLKHIPYVEIYTICQFINWVLWLVEVKWPYCKLWYVLFLHLIIVGLFGGASYVSCFYFILESKTIDPKLKELCVNIGTIFNDLGILFASITTLILDNTWMKK